MFEEMVTSFFFYLSINHRPTNSNKHTTMEAISKHISQINEKSNLESARAKEHYTQENIDKD